jgi:hypothetical protein
MRPVTVTEFKCPGSLRCEAVDGDQIGIDSEINGITIIIVDKNHLMFRRCP